MAANEAMITLGSSQKQYRKPPVVEAVCEIRLARDKPWTQSLVGLLFAELHDEFPLERTVDAMSTDLQIGANTVTQRMQPVLITQFEREDESALVQIAPGLLSVNQLEPYPGWPTFRTLIRKVLDVYVKLVEPTSVVRLGLRYVNRIQIPRGSIDLSDYFSFYPFIGEAFPTLMTNFATMAEFPFGELRDVLRVQHSGVMTGEPTQRTTLLDLDYFLRSPGTVQLVQIADWLEEAHSNVEACFEASLTTRLQRLFEDVNDGEDFGA